jgi:hypothetical protein
MERYTSLEHYQASIQLESDYRNLVVYNDDIKNFHDKTKQGSIARKLATKTLESIMNQKRILGLNFNADVELLTKIKFE